MEDISKQFADKERFVLDFFIDYRNELEESINILNVNRRRFIKSQICLAFIAADTFSRFFQIITKQNASQKNVGLLKGFLLFLKRNKRLNYQNEKRFKEWFNKFVLTTQNQTYKNNIAKFNDCDVSALWRLRCSLLHFFSLPNPKYGNFVLGGTSLNNQLAIIINKKEKKKLNMKLIYNDELIEAIFLSMETQIADLEKMIKDKPQDYIKGIEECYKILQAEGTEVRDFSKFKNKK